MGSGVGEVKDADDGDGYGCAECVARRNDAGDDAEDGGSGRMGSGDGARAAEHAGDDGTRRRD